MSPTVRVTLFLAASMALVLLQVPAAYYLSKNWSPDQILLVWKRPGVPLKYHGGWWGDLLLLPIVFGWVVYKFGQTWDAKMIAIMLAIGFAFNLANHIGLIKGQTFIDPYGHPGEKWSTVIGLHFVYASAYIGLVGLFYLSPGVTFWEVVGVSAIVGVHTMIGMHIPLGALNEIYRWDWCPQDLLNEKLLTMQIGLWATLAGFATYAAGSKAGLLVLAIGICAALAFAVAGALALLGVWAFYMFLGED